MIIIANLNFSTNATQNSYYLSHYCLQFPFLVIVIQLNGDLEIETNDLTNSLNPNYYDPSGDKWLRIYRVGNIKFLSILFKAKDLTGHEVIATDIPTKLRPVMACYGVIQGRDTGEWVKATYVPVVLSVGRESLTISTGVNASKAVYITGMVCYV